MAEPKLALIPSAYKTGTVYSPLPTNGDGNFAFTRNTEATRVNKDGLIETVGNNIPRLDYSDGGCPSLLLEPSRTNIVTHSENFADASWSPTNVSLTTADVISPSGDLNATKIEGTAVSTKRIFDVISTTASSTYTYSLYVKKGNTPTLSFLTSSGSINCTFNLDTLTASNGSIEDAGNGWYRLSATGTASGVSEVFQILLNSSEGAGTFQFIYGAQVEQGSYATSYIPTNGGISTRASDLCIGAGNSNVFNDDEGVLFFKGKFPNTTATANRYITLSDSGGSPYTNQISFYFFSNTAVIVYIGGASTATQAFRITNIDIQDSEFKIALQYKFGDNKLFFNGVEYTQQGTFVDSHLTGLNDISFTNDDSVDFSLNMKVQDLRYYDTTLTDAALIELTTL